MDDNQKLFKRAFRYFHHIFIYEKSLWNPNIWFQIVCGCDEMEFMLDISLVPLIFNFLVYFILYVCFS